MADLTQAFRDATGAAPGGGSVLGAFRSAVQEQERPLADRVRSAFSITPKGIIREEWEKERLRIVDETKRGAGEALPRIGGQPAEGPEIKLSIGKDGPRGFTVGDSDEVQFSNRLPEVNDRIKRRIERRADLLRRVEETGESVGFIDEFRAAGKLSREGAAGLLADKFKPGEKGTNVFPTFKDGKIDKFIIIDEKDGNKLKIADPSDFQVAALEATPGIVGQIIGASQAAKRGVSPTGPAVVGGAAGDFIGSVGRELFDAFSPGESFPDEKIAEKLLSGGGRTLFNVGAGAASELGGQAAIKATRALKPSEFTRRGFTGRGGIAGGQFREGRPIREFEQEIAEGRRLESEIGEPLRAGQLLQTPRGLGAEIGLATGEGAKTIAESTARQVAATGRAIDKTILEVAGRDIQQEGVQGISAKFGGQYADHVRSLVKQRSEQVRPLVERFDVVAGGKPALPMKNSLDAIEKAVRETGGAFNTDEAARVVGQMRKMQDELLEATKSGDVPKATIRQFQNTMAGLGEVAFGNAKLADKIQPDKGRVIAKQLLDAMNLDLDTAIKSGGVTGEAGQLLRQFRDVWRVGSKEIASIQNKSTDALLKLLDADDAGTFARKFLSGSISNRRVRETMAIFRKVNPEMAEEFAGAALRDLVTKQGATKGGELSFGKLASALNNADNRGKILALLADSPGGKAAYNRLNTIMQFSKRASAAGVASGGSRTTPLARQWLLRAEQKIPFGIGGIPVIVLDLINKYSNPRVLAETITDPTKRDLFLGIVDPPRGAKRQAIIGAATRLTNLLNQDRGGQDE